MFHRHWLLRYSSKYAPKVKAWFCHHWLLKCSPECALAVHNSVDISTSNKLAFGRLTRFYRENRLTQSDCVYSNIGERIGYRLSNITNGDFRTSLGGSTWRQDHSSKFDLTRVILVIISYCKHATNVSSRNDNSAQISIW